jgi:hypothetical protein
VTSWATVTLALGTALIGAGAGLLGGWLQRHANERRELRERGAAAVGSIVVLLDDIDPDRVLWTGEAALTVHRKRLAEASDRWQVLREQLVVYAVGHPSPRISPKAVEVVTAVGQAIPATRAYVESYAEQGDHVGPRKDAQSCRDEAAEALEKLIREVRG